MKERKSNQIKYKKKVKKVEKEDLSLSFVLLFVMVSFEVYS